MFPTRAATEISCFVGRWFYRNFFWQNDVEKTKAFSINCLEEARAKEKLFIFWRKGWFSYVKKEIITIEFIITKKMINQSYGEKSKMTVITMSLEKETWEFEKNKWKQKKHPRLFWMKKLNSNTNKLTDEHLSWKLIVWNLRKN